MLRYFAPHRLWLTADRQRLVEDGHPEAAVLFAKAGDELSVRTAFALGLISTHAFAGQLEDGRCEACLLLESHGIHATTEIKQRQPQETKVLLPKETKRARKRKNVPNQADAL